MRFNMLHSVALCFFCFCLMSTLFLTTVQHVYYGIIFRYFCHPYMHNMTGVA